MDITGALAQAAGAASLWTQTASALRGLADEALNRLCAAIRLGQSTRLLQMDTALPDGSLVVERMTLREAVHAHEPLWADVDCFSTSAHLELKALMGAPATLRLVLADGSHRIWQGVVAQAAQLGSDGGLARYRVVLAAWTHWLQHRRDARIFQDQTAQDVVSTVFQAYPAAAFRFDVASPGPMRALTTQYRETDWAFACRLMADEGWSWRLEHDPAEEGRHVLVVFDGQATLPDLGPLRFGRTELRHQGGLSEDTITAWSLGQVVTPNALTMASWDERRVGSLHSEAGALGTHGDVPTLAMDLLGGERRHADGRVDDAQPGSQDVAQARADARMAALALHHVTVQAQGAVRALREGGSFTLTGHHQSHATGASAYDVLTVTHEVVNNLGSEVADILQVPEFEQGSYRNRFDAVPAGTRMAPLPHVKPTAPGPQLAVVMAKAGEPLTCDRDGRIRVQFAWQRGAVPWAGGLSGTTSPTGLQTGHAPGDERSGAWVRVAQHLAGPNWGGVFTPRQGTEVLVDFVDGDIDRPLVIGQLHNGQHDLPWPAGDESGANHAGVLSGWHHPHLDGAGSNQWLVDDTTGQLRMRLVSQGPVSGWHELGLGYLIQQSGGGGAGHAQRGTWLGEGFYGHTDGWAVVRAGQGLLLSTSQRGQRGASVTGTQMDAAEAVAQLKAARELAEALSASAQHQGAQVLSSAADGQAWQHHTDQMDPQAQGRFDGDVNGHAARKAQGRALGDPVERFASPLLHLDTPSTAAWVTPTSISLFSGADTSLVSQGDVQMSSAHTVSSVSGQTTSLYTHAGGIQAITANAALSLRAHTDAQQIWSDQDLTVQSTTDEIRIQANKAITLTAGQSQIEIKGGDITFTCPGTWTVKGGAHEWGGGGGVPASSMVLPSRTITPQGTHSVQFLVKGPNGLPLRDFSYEIVEKTSGVPVIRGVTDEDGCTERYYTEQGQELFELHEYFEYGRGVFILPSAREHDESLDGV